MDVTVKEVCGGNLGGNSRGTDATLTELEERMAAVRESQADVDAAMARVAEAQAQDASEAERRYQQTLFGRKAPSSLEVGQALADALLPRGTTTRAREAGDGLGPVISGAAAAHSHGALRHSHDRLAGPHFHCMHCGSDSRLCLDNPHHAEGPTAVREASMSSPAAFGARVGDLLFENTGPSRMGYAEHLAAQAIEEAAAVARPARQTTAADRRLTEAWERACGGSRP